ncbi:proton-dependent oligopeptide transporter family [Artemisia annua]|uniref:Proton-dependent oligopeptide transporter family n=1 Tax=Artemisia annua TaxID=35608 RepID=A0A2U1PQR8_ARTAN|nr:proton-dependent oligopeptide transporter family [Artemisia annua]
MGPMWVTYLVVSAISATGSTFFYEQFNNLNTVNKMPIQIYDLVRKLSSFGILHVYRLLSCSHKNDKLKIGVGMLCALICCVFAWQLEVQRLEVVRRKVDRDANTSLSFLWLVPQFCVLGCMEGLTREGLLEFYESQINDERLKSYGEDYLEFVMGVGKLINISIILIIQSQKEWFGRTINDSRLDKYYVILVYICLANFIIYCCVTLWFYKHAEQIQGQANGDSQQNQQLLAINDYQQDHRLVVRDESHVHDHPLVLVKDDSQHDHQLVIKDDSQQNHQSLSDEESQEYLSFLANPESQQDHLSYYISSKTSDAEQSQDHIM